MIILCFKEFRLGKLSFDEYTQEFVYDSFAENENKANEKYDIFETYFLAQSKNKRSKFLFAQFSEIAGCLTRPDIIRLAEIEKEDNLFVKLEKLSKLNLNDSAYFIRYEK